MGHNQRLSDQRRVKYWYRRCFVYRNLIEFHIFIFKVRQAVHDYALHFDALIGLYIEHGTIVRARTMYTVSTPIICTRRSTVAHVNQAIAHGVATWITEELQRIQRKVHHIRTCASDTVMHDGHLIQCSLVLCRQGTNDEDDILLV